MCGPDAVAVATEGYLRDVRDALCDAVRHAAESRNTVVAAVAASALERATRLEDAVAGLAAGGGKLVRPRLVFLGYLATALTDRDCAIDAVGRHAAIAARCPDLIRLGCALELLHVFGLLQDDVMDESDTRRGTASAHRAFAAAHETARPGPGPGRSPAAARFGESCAVLAGDLAFALAQRQIRTLPAPVGDAWDDMVLELVQGQRLDLVFAADGRFDQAGAGAVARAKTGGYSVARPLLLGALLARPNAAPPDWLRVFGDEVGDAFALADDLLGVFGDPAVTGKPIADDIRAGKSTTVLAIADELLPDGLADRLGPSRPTPTQDQIVRLRDDMTSHGVRAEAQRRLRAHVDRAEEALRELTCAPVRTELLSVAHCLARRQV